MVIEEIVVDYNLIHLQNILFDLDNYSFDREIINQLNKLKFLVDKKLYSKFNLKNLDINKFELIAKYYLKNTTN